MARAHFGIRILNTHAARAAPARWNTKLFFTPAAVRAAVSKFLEKITFILVWNFFTSGLIWKRIQKTHGADAAATCEVSSAAKTAETPRAVEATEGACWTVQVTDANDADTAAANSAERLALLLGICG